MAGIEQLVVHSKSYVVRWIQVSQGQSISWSVEPHKKSINFGVFKHPGTKSGVTPTLPTDESFDTSTSPPAQPLTPGLDGTVPPSRRGRQGSVSKNEASTAVEKLAGAGIKCVAWEGKCEADKVTTGRYDVAEGQSGMYGLVFDNTFSRQVSKTVHFVVNTHATDVAPMSGNSLQHSRAFATSSTSVGKKASPLLQPIPDSPEESLPPGTVPITLLQEPRPASRGRGLDARSMQGATFYTGILHKKRRKKAQGFAKRFFSLDYTSSTLSYYRDMHSSALRGAMPLSLAAVGVNIKTREFSVDSGAEVWHLKALSKRDFDGWRVALERASTSVLNTSVPATPAIGRGSAFPRAMVPNPAEDQEWHRVEELVSKVSGTRDAIRSLAKDTDPKYISGANGVGLGLTRSGESSSAPSPSSYESANPYFPDMDEQGQGRRPFWKRKPSQERGPPSFFKRSVSAQLAVPTSSAAATPVSTVPGSLTIQKRPSIASHHAAYVEQDVHERCMALLRDLDGVVSDFASLLAESRARRVPPMSTAASRMSIDSIDDQEFFDAEDGARSPSQLLSIGPDVDEEGREQPTFDHVSEADSDTSSDTADGAGESSLFSSTPKAGQSALFSSLPATLPPLPLDSVKRRTTIPPPQQAPPSIIGFLRKNAGKDLSTVSMPVTANEPTSLLQRLAESMEYSRLLDSAASTSITPAERLMYVSAFAISYFANSRVKERAIRKPFNPMLGETYELVREDLGFCFLAEKVCHRPVRMACQAESLNNGGWAFAQSPQPIQKFWGKSVELNTEGRARLVLHAAKEQYSWNQATCFLRNVIAGEKYVEPVQSMTIVCETTAMRAVASFKAGGMFAGRSEDVTVQLFDASKGDTPLPLGLVGKWTESLKRTDSGETVWSVGPLAGDSSKGYGLTTFAASLNEITTIERDQLAPTDSRLRPDQQALEHGDVDKAEALKARLEERQRGRRKVLETHGQEWKPQFFEKVGGDSVAEGEEVWMLKGQKSYWDRRLKQDWADVHEVFEL